MARNGKHNGHNTFRFLPGRKEAATDGKMLFPGLRYSRRAVPTDKGFIAGVAIGPGQHASKDDVGPGFALSKGGVIVPVIPNAELQTVPVRDFTPKKDKTGRAKQYVDWATFQQNGASHLFNVVPHTEDGVLYGEIWTGDYDQSEGAYQLIQANVFGHGSVAFAGGTALIKTKDESLDADDAKQQKAERKNVRASKAEMVGESQGLVVGGIPLWTARLWKIRYSAKDSEAILVRQLNRFYLVLAKGGDVEQREVPESRYLKHFERLMGEDLIADTAKAESSVAATAANAA